MRYFDLKNKNVKKVIIKEARPFGEYENKEDNGIVRLKNEYSKMNQLEGTDITPAIIDYLIYELI